MSLIEIGGSTEPKDIRVVVVAEISGRQLIGVYEGTDELKPGIITLADPLQYGEPQPGKIMLAPVSAAQVVDSLCVNVSSIWEVSSNGKLHENYFSAVEEWDRVIRAANSGITLAGPGGLGGIKP